MLGTKQNKTVQCIIYIQRSETNVYTNKATPLHITNPVRKNRQMNCHQHFLQMVIY